MILASGSLLLYPALPPWGCPWGEFLLSGRATPDLASVRVCVTQLEQLSQLTESHLLIGLGLARTRTCFVQRLREGHTCTRPLVERTFLFASHLQALTLVLVLLLETLSSNTLWLKK